MREIFIKFLIFLEVLFLKISKNIAKFRINLSPVKNSKVVFRRPNYNKQVEVARKLFRVQP